jgi:serine/threonine protein kinase
MVISLLGPESQQAALQPQRNSQLLDPMMISLLGLKPDSQGYFLGAYLDRGGYGIVTSVIHRDKPNLLFARKQIPKAVIDYQDLKNEVQLIHQARHRHVIRIVEEYQDDTNFYIVMEPVATGNLHQYLQEMTRNGSQTLGWKPFGDRRLQLFRFIRCLATTVKEVHSRGIRHRDIKPQNILTQDQVVILTDFGTSFASEEATKAVFTRTWGTDKYEPPEAFLRQKEGPSRALKNRTGRLGDIFGLGCTFYEILEALSIQANFPQVNDNYAAHIADKTFVDKVRSVREHNLLVSKRLEEEHRLPNLVEKMLKLVINHMMVSVEERKDATFVLDVINQIYNDYDELQSGCCIDANCGSISLF